MFCTKCGTEYKGNYCPRGCNSPYRNQKKPISSLLIIVALIFVFPLGIVLMWINCSWHKAVKIIISAIIGLLFISASCSLSESTNVDNTSSNESIVDSQSQETVIDSGDLEAPVVSSPESTPKDEIIYEAVDLQLMIDELHANALKAETTYQDKYIEVVAKISSFDSDGSYVSVEPVNADRWNLDTVLCRITNDEQIEFLLGKSVGDRITIKGKIISVGEILGYSMKIAEIY